MEFSIAFDPMFRTTIVVFLVIGGFGVAIKGFSDAHEAECTWFDAEGRSARARLARARVRRLGIEGRPHVPLGLVHAGFLWILAIITATPAVPFCEGVGLYAASVATMEMLVLARIRRRERMRYATLAIRTPHSAAPAWFWIVVTTLSALPLLWSFVVPEIAAVVALCGLVALRGAWQVAVMPALISGTDVPAETLVDAEMRRNRTVHQLSLAVGPAYVFVLTAPASVRVHLYILYALMLVPVALSRVARPRGVSSNKDLERTLRAVS